MKGRTRCPKCNHTFVVDVPLGVEQYTVTCPKCKHSFIILPHKKEEKPCSKWEEFGGSRKTILPSLIKMTKRPLIASVLLFTVTVLGVFTAITILYNPMFLGGFFSSIGLGLLNEPTYRGLWFIIVLVCSFLAATGGYAAFNKKPLSFAIIGGVAGTFSFGLLFIGPILSILATALIVLSKDEFENGIHGKEF